jgi:hypothetical protein
MGVALTGSGTISQASPKTSAMSAASITSIGAPSVALVLRDAPEGPTKPFRPGEVSHCP